MARYIILFRQRHAALYHPLFPTTCLTQADHWIHKVVDLYTSAQYWLQSNYPRGYIVVFVVVSIVSSSLYIFDIVTDMVVAKVSA